ncbi:MAG: hypothetical protein AAB425_07820, partial [Bdellovibrionota bacterium]
MRRYVQLCAVFSAVLTLVAAGSSPLQASDQDDADSPNPLLHLKGGYSQFGNSRTTAFLGAGVTVSLASYVFLDRELRSYFADQDRLRGVEAIGNFYGLGIVGGSIGVVSIGAGILFAQPREL